MHYRILLVLLIFSVISCGAKPLPPSVAVKRFEDMNYPCIRVDFPDQIRYKDMDMYKTEENLAVVYKLVMPNYDIDIVKLYGLIDDINWSYESLGEIHNSSSTLFNKKGRDDEPAVSAVITFFERKGDLFLRGSVGEFISKDRAYRVDVVRRIKSVGSFRRDVINNWQSSSTGKKTIENMQNIINYIYENAGVVDCKFRGNIDMDWWKK